MAHARLSARSSPGLFRYVFISSISDIVQVVMIRQMAQYVGGETKYGGIIDTIKTIIAEEGYAGLYS